MILIGTLLIVLLGAMAGEIEAALAFALLFGLFAMQRSFKQEINELKQQIQQLKQISQATEVKPSEAKAPPPIVETAEPGQVQATQRVSTKTQATEEPELVMQLDMPESADADWTESSKSTQRKWPENKFDKFVKQASQAVISYFTDGNIFVRVGLLVLFVGVAFLLKYAAENSKIPIEFRFLGAAIGGLALIVFGWRLRAKKEVFALLLQGGGMGIIYITIFASYRIADLIPSNLTFVLLVVFALTTAALAVLQNSRSLAMYAVLGGFLAPFLASSGSGNYIGLFGYYAVLNLVVFSIAWFKAWRLLNLMGFAFTFGVFTLWFVTSYQQEMMVSAGLFLLLFFSMYSVLGILYALKQTQDLKGLVDGTLVFGTPLVSSSLAMLMMRHLEYGIAITSIGLGVYYIVLARFMWNRIGEQTRLMAEAMLAIGVVFATLAVPYALDGHWSTATWALEAAGILWVSLRQNRYYAQIFAIVLQLGAGILFLFRNADDIGDMAWMNPAFLGGTFVALGALISARLLYQLDRTNHLHQAHWLFYGWGIGWWLMSALIQIDYYVSNEIFAVLSLLIVTCGLLLYLDRFRSWNWLPASITLALLLPALYLMALYSAERDVFYLSWPNMLPWILALALNYLIIFKLESVEWSENTLIGLYTGFFFLVVAMFSVELTGRFYHQFPEAGLAYLALLAVVPLFTIWWVRQGKMAVLQRFGQPLQLSITATLVVFMVLWSLGSNLTNNGSAIPLPFMPLLNPIDLAHLVFFIAVVRSLKLLDEQQAEYRNWIMAGLGGLAFIWISALFLRSMHHYTGVPFDLDRMLLNAGVQTGLSILWTLIGMLGILYASRKSMRPLWIAGAILVGVVLVKLIFADLRASGTIERIISFLVVGGLLVAMGYFSPIPPKKNSEQDNIKKDDENNQRSQTGAAHE